jgi:hypothetical protein
VNARNNRGSLGTAAYLALSKRTKDDHQKAKEVVELLLCHSFDMQSEKRVILSAVVESDNILPFSFLRVLPGSFSSMVRLDSASVRTLASKNRATDICHSLLQTNAADVSTCDTGGTTALAAAVKRGGSLSVKNSSQTTTRRLPSGTRKAEHHFIQTLNFGPGK